MITPNEALTLIGSLVALSCFLAGRYLLPSSRHATCAGPADASCLCWREGRRAGWDAGARFHSGPPVDGPGPADTVHDIRLLPGHCYGCGSTSHLWATCPVNPEVMADGPAWRPAGDDYLARFDPDAWWPDGSRVDSPAAELERFHAELAEWSATVAATGAGYWALQSESGDDSG